MEDRETRSLALWDPFEEIGPFARWPFRSVGRAAPVPEHVWGPGRGFGPAVDVTESDDHYIVTVELPGLKKDDVTIELHEGTLAIRGEKRSERDEKREHRRHVERSFGTFSRSFSLPANVDSEHIDARFEDGVLTVKVRKTEEAKPKTVDIKG
jgi:HSP20 family protein